MDQETMYCYYSFLKKMIQTASSVVWWFTSIILFLVTVVAATTFTLSCLHGCLASTKCYRDIPTIKMRPVLSFWEWLVRAYKQKSLRAFVLRMIAAICKVYYNYKFILLWFGFQPMIFFFKPETVEILLNNSRIISKSAEYRFLQPWLGTGLLTSSGVKWRSHRKLLTPTFHFEILENFLTVFNKEAAVLTRKLGFEVGRPWIDIVPMITMCTLDTICQTAMGVDLNIQSGSGKEYIRRIDEIIYAFFYRVYRPWLWSDLVFLYCSPTGWKYRKNVKALHDFTRKIIKEKKEFILRNQGEGNGESALSGKPKRKAFLELLLEHHLKDNSFTEENIREEVDTFMFEGHDTTGMSISWTLYELGQHPKIQEKLYLEIESIFGNDKERKVTSEDLKRMKYMERTIKESLRLYPSVPFIARELTETVEIDEYILPRGCTCFICIFVLHQDPKQFPVPEVFDPDRFLPENSSKRHPYAYIPFSAGPRNCIGQKFALMEEKTVLAHIIRKFKVTSLDPRDKIETLAGLVLKNEEPVRIHLALR